MTATPQVRREVLVAAPREVVFEMFTDPALLVTWLGVSAELDPRPGGEFRFEVAPGEACSGHYVEVEPPTRVSFTWGWESGAIPVAPGSTLVTVELDEVEGGTRVRLAHEGLEGDARALHEHGWDGFLGRLVAVAAGRDPGPDPASRTPDEVLAELREEGPA